VTIVQEAGWAPGPVWTGEKNLAATGIRSTDLPACIELLYRLSSTDLHSHGTAEVYLNCEILYSGQREYSVFPRVFLETSSIGILRHGHLVLDILLILMWWEVRGVPIIVVTTESSTQARQ